MKTEENKIDKLEKSVSGLEQAVDNLSSGMRQGFARVDKTIEDLAAITAKGFEQVDKRFEQVDKRFEGIDQHLEKIDATLNFHTDILEAHTTTLNHLDQERIFSLNYIQRLENEVEKIKKQLKIA